MPASVRGSVALIAYALATLCRGVFRRPEDDFNRQLLRSVASGVQLEAEVLAGASSERGNAFVRQLIARVRRVCSAMAIRQ